MDLSLVTKTEHYAGLFKSSAKVTLYLSDGSVTPSGAISTPLNDFESWECQVCNYRNPPGLSPAAARICALCGVPRTSVPSSSKPTLLSLDRHVSSSPSSAPSSRAGLPSRSTTPDTIPCPACTFLNHPSFFSCEICSTPLPKDLQRLAMKSAPPTRSVSPDLREDEEDNNPTNRFIKLSFRKSGDKPFYSVLRRTLLAKGWEVPLVF